MVRRRLNWFAELAGSMVQVWVQLSVTWIPRPGAAFVDTLEIWLPPLPPTVVLLVTAKLGPSGTETDGAIEFNVCAVPIEIVTWEGTNSGSLTACARL